MGEDDVQVGLLVAFGMIAFSFLLVIPGIRGLEVNTLTVARYICVSRGRASSCMTVNALHGYSA